MDSACFRMVFRGRSTIFMRIKMLRSVMSVKIANVSKTPMSVCRLKIDIGDKPLRNIFDRNALLALIDNIAISVSIGDQLIITAIKDGIDHYLYIGILVCTVEVVNHDKQRYDNKDLFKKCHSCSIVTRDKNATQRLFFFNPDGTI